MAMLVKAIQAFCPLSLSRIKDFVASEVEPGFGGDDDNAC